MDTPTVERMLRVLRREVRQWKVPAVGRIADEAADRAFETLVSTILSLRTKDAVTAAASRKLLRRASTAAAIAALSEPEIERLIYPVGFYRTKAVHLRKACMMLQQRYAGQVPRSLEQLLQLPGVGRKTANLVVTVGYGDYGICVDTHVHRIMNLWGYVATRTPDETEMQLRQKLPRKNWKTLNDILVTFGQNLCVPISPWCSRCPVSQYCSKVGLTRSR